jgi:hypothetical protein
MYDDLRLDDIEARIEPIRRQLLLLLSERPRYPLDVIVALISVLARWIAISTPDELLDVSLDFIDAQLRLQAKEARAAYVASMGPEGVSVEEEAMTAALEETGKYGKPN